MMKRHLGKPVEVELEDGDILLMAPLKIMDIPDLMDVQSKIANVMGKEDKVLLSKDISQSLIGLIKKSIVLADPKLETESQLVDDFIAKNFLTLMPKLFELNSLSSGRDKIKQEKIQRVKERIQNESNKGGSDEI